MPPPPIIDPATLDFTHPVADREAILAAIPHRFEFKLLDAMVLCDSLTGVFAGFHDVREDAWWTRGHIPGRPLFPGVLMIEVAAQMASFIYHTYVSKDSFLGFTGVDAVRFRGAVTPPARFVVVGRATELKRRRVVCSAQGFVQNVMVFEGTITGMPV